MTAPPEGTAFTLLSFIIRQLVGTIYALCAAYVTEAINKGYTWKGVRGGTNISASLSPSFSGSWSCHVCLDLLKDKASAYGEA